VENVLAVSVGENPPSDLQDRIRVRAYELYESRGYGHGCDEQDWLRAEQEILGN